MEENKRPQKLHVYIPADEETQPLWDQRESHELPHFRGQPTPGILNVSHSHQTRRNLLVASFLLLCASVIIFKPHLAMMVPPSYLPAIRQPPEARIDKLHHYEDSSGALASAYTAAWNNTGGREVAVKVCHHRRICIEGRKRLSKRVQYYLTSDKTIGDVSEVREAISPCFQTIHPKEEHFGLIDLDTYKKPVTWVKGKTLGFLKDEDGAHPAAWGRFWTSFLSAAIKARPLFEKAGLDARQFFDHYQLFEQVVDLTGWNQFFMTAATTAARSSLHGGRFEKHWHPAGRLPSIGSRAPTTSTNRQYATWADERAFLETDGLTCFEEMVSVARSEDYYLDTEHARYLRRVGLDALGLPEHRTRSCQKEKLNIVYLRRDRPVWNEAEVLGALQSLGVPISIREIDGSTPYATQVDIFYSADIVVSVHGSQLQNQHFMEPGSAILQFFPYHYWNVGQQKLAQWTGVNVVEMRNNSLPPRELIAAYNNPSYLARWDRVNASIPEFPTEKACNKVMRCYQSSRDLGVYVNIAELKQRMVELISGFEERDECEI